MWKKMLIMLAAFALVFAVLAFVKYRQVSSAIAKFANFSLPPEAVTSVKAEQTDWQDTIEVTGTFAPVQGVTISAEEPGKITKIAFESGAKVQQGDILLQQDIAVETAQLASADARIDLARTKLARFQKLLLQNATTQAEVDDAQAEVKKSAADADAVRATIERKTIRAPFTGRTGIREIQQGQYLKAGDAIVSLQTLDPIYLDFQVPQQRLAQLSTGQIVELKVDTFPDTIFPAKISAIAPLVDATTRNARVQALVPNPREEVRSGMFARVTVMLGSGNKYITVPITAISRAPYGDSIYVIEKMKNDKGVEYLGVRQQAVKVGPARGDQIAILSGIKANEEVVTSGLFKLRPGGAVTVNNVVMPSSSAAPHPAES